jgi:cell division protein FtsW
VAHRALGLGHHGGFGCPVNAADEEGGVKLRPLGVDRWMLGAVTLLCAFGLIMVFSSSEALGYLTFRNPGYYFQRQLLWMFLGLVMGLFALAFDYHRLRALAPIAAIAIVILLLLVLVPHIGVAHNGSRRWFAIAGFTLQPAELAKIILIVYLARWLEKAGGKINSARQGLVPFLLMMGLLVGLVLLEKDLGTSLVRGLIAISMFVVAGASWTHVMSTLGLMGGAMVMLIKLEPYRYQRLAAFFNPWADSLNTGFQSVQSVLALGSGGLFGVGLGQSVQKYQWLPEAHTDFIFAIIGEEVGLLGTVFVLGLFCVLAWRGYRTALRAPDRFGLLLATGITSWITFQAFVNIAAVTVVLPTTGIPLPFISFGGSSLTITLAAVGLLLNISAQGVKPVVARRAGVDIGRRHRGARVPRAGSSARAF